MRGHLASCGASMELLSTDSRLAFTAFGNAAYLRNWSNFTSELGHLVQWNLHYRSAVSFGRIWR